MFKKEWIGLVFVMAGILLAVMLAFFDTFWVIGLVGAFTVFALVMWKLEVGIAVLTFAVIADSVFRSMGGVGGLWDEVFFVLAIISLIWRFVKDERTDFNPTALWWGVAGFFIVALVSGFTSTLPYGHIVTAIRSVIQGTIIYFVIVNANFDRKTILHLISSLILCGVIAATYAVYQKVTGMFTPQEWLDVEEVVNVTRATSFTGSPNATAGFLAMLVPPAAAMMLKVKRFWTKVIWAGMSFALVLGLYATLNRAAWIGLAVGLIVLAIAAGKRWWIWAMSVCVVGLIILLPGLKERFISMFSEDFAWRNVTYGRGFRWNTAIEIFKKNPFFGIGPGGFGGAVAYGIQAFGGLYVDNYYLLTLSSYGLAGLGMFLFMLISNIREAFKGLRKCVTSDRLLVAGLIGGMVAFMTHLVAENLWQITPLVISFWLVSAFASALARTKREEHESF